MLAVRDLRVHFQTPDGIVRAVDGVSLDIPPGGALGVAGESGSGKSVLAMTLMGLTRAPNARIEGQVLLDGRDLLAAREDELRSQRGNDVAMIFQDPMSSLHPLHRVGAQVAEAVLAHNAVSRKAARGRAVELLALAELPEPARVASAWPHELSGGMRQRAMIAMAVANEPHLLIADEPTTALDVTVQAQILALVRRLREELGMALLLISHDLGVLAQNVDQAAVMYAGRIVERAPAATLFGDPQHPYTWGLLRSLPRIDAGRDARLQPIPGRPPSLVDLPGGCAFHPRCAYVRERHRTVVPPLEPLADDSDHEVACLLDPATRRRLRDGEGGK
jgi:peptide/nickel transport system ATP-binding protein